MQAIQDADDNLGQTLQKHCKQEKNSENEYTLMKISGKV
jgi:hypothetical protein